MPWKKTNIAAEEKDEPKNASQTVKTIVGIILCVLLLPILIINVTLIVKSYTRSNEIPSIGGIFPLIVLTDSMYPEIESGDLIICHTIDAEDVKVGDIICFFDPNSKSGTNTVTHRVVEITQTEEGELAFRTKGDANNAEDNALAPASKLVGVFQRRMPGLGNAAMFMQTTTGLIVCVVLPALLLVAIDLLRTRRYEKKHKQDTDSLMRELEELRARQAAMAAQAVPAAAAVNPPPEEKKPDPAPAEEPKPEEKEPKEAPAEEPKPEEKEPKEAPPEEPKPEEKEPEEAPPEEESKKLPAEEEPQEKDPPAEDSGNEAPEEFAETPDESDADTGEEIGEIGDGEIGEGGGGVGEGGGGDV